MSTNLSGEAAFQTPSGPVIPPTTANATREAAIAAAGSLHEWRPRTPLGMKLKEFRSKFIAEGGRLLTVDEINAELLDRRGSMASES